MQDNTKRVWKMILARWWIVPLIGLLLLFVDLGQDYSRKRQSFLDILNTEFIFALFLISAGFILGLYWQRIASEKTELKKLTMQRDFSVQLASAKDWDEISKIVSNFLTTFSNILASYLYVFDPAVGSFHRVAFWVSEQLSGERKSLFEHRELCIDCVARKDPFVEPNLCNAQESVRASNLFLDYCLPLHVDLEQIGIFRFILAHNETLTPTQFETLRTLIPYLATVMQSAARRQMMIDHSISDAAENERRSLTHDLHDTLGQNISYLRLKLDQMVRNGGKNPNEKVQKDLDHMLMVAAESSELVQETLIILDPDDAPPLSKIIKEYCEIVGARSNLEIKFSLSGKPVYLSQQTSRQVFYLLREALSNIEKHAQASRVSVSLLWSGEELQISIDDNGVGFVQDDVPPEGHFGLKSMRQRVEGLKGEFAMISFPGQGTQLSFRIPYMMPTTETSL